MPVIDAPRRKRCGRDIAMFPSGFIVGLVKTTLDYSGNSLRRAKRRRRFKGFTAVALARRWIPMRFKLF